MIKRKLLVPEYEHTYWNDQDWYFSQRLNEIIMSSIKYFTS